MYKRIILSVIVLVFLAGCGKGNNEKKIKNEISKYKSRIVEIQSKIINLENKLKNIGGNSENIGIPVRVRKVSKQRFEHFFTVNGSIEAVDEAFISPEVPGQIEKIFVKEGQRVKKGDLLVKLNSNVVESSLSELSVSLKLAKIMFKKRDELWKKRIGSEVQYLEAKNRVESLQKKINTLQEQLKLYEIKAPFSGIVDNISKKRGEMASPGLPLMFVVNLEKVYAVSDVSEMYISKIKKGDEGLVTFPSFPGLERKAKIYQIGTVVNPQNRTFRIKLLLNNSSEILKPNMIATVKLRDFVSEEAIVVPSILVKNDLKGNFLYIASDEKDYSISKKIYVTTGMINGSDLLITSGLSSGDMVIVEGYSLVKNGSRIKIIR